MRSDISSELKEEYNRFVHSLELLNIYIEALSFKKTGDVPENDQIPIKVTLKPTKNAYRETEENTYEISHTVLFRLEYIENAKKEKFFELKATYKLVYRSKVKLTDEIFKIFVKKNVPINVFPFLRETVHNCMYRAGLPPLLLPLVKLD
jgi:preprotein translocase subunit SecB